MSGKISDRIRGGKLPKDVVITAQRPDMERVKNDTAHDGHRLGQARRKR